jgi:predicted dehydrogenase
MRIGIIGTGSMGVTHAEAWAATPARVVGVVSRHFANAQRLAAQCGAQAYASLSDMLSDVDVIDICTPTGLHLEQTLIAAAAGKHVVCEKPIARTLEQAQAMIAACERHGVKLLVAHVVRYFDDYAEAYERVAHGEVGAPQLLRLMRLGSMPTGWFADADESGGVLLDLMIHDYDFARWVAGDVTSVETTCRDVTLDGVTAQHAFVTLRHTGGAVSLVEGSWANRGRFRTAFTIVGERGLTEFDTAVPANASERRNPYVVQAQAFYAALAHDAPLRVTAADGLEALRIALAAIESARMGAVVTRTLPDPSPSG